MKKLHEVFGGVSFPIVLGFFILFAFAMLFVVPIINNSLILGAILIPFFLIGSYMVYSMYGLVGDMIKEK